MTIVYCLNRINYYGVIFDHLISADNPDPEVLAISIIELDNDGGAFANEVLSFPIDPTEFTGKKVLAVPRCCQVKRGTRDPGRINGLVAERDGEKVMRSAVKESRGRPVEREDRPLDGNGCFNVSA